LKLACLYPVVNLLDDGDGATSLSLAVALAEAGVTLMQLRCKTAGTGNYSRLASQLVEALQPLGCSLLINDRVDVALASGAAGVHLGQDDLPVEEARAILGTEAIIGLSSHELAEAERGWSAAADARPDYLAFGPVFESPTKAGVRSARGIDALARVCKLSPLPVVAIGGITLELAPSIRSAGAVASAVISELEQARAPGQLARRWLAELSS